MHAGSATDAAEIRERLRWLIKLRWVGCAGAFAVIQIVWLFSPVRFPLLPAYLVLGCVVLYNLYFRQRLKDYSGDLQRNAVSQIGLDYLVLTAAVYFSGDSNSPFLYYYLFHIVISGILLPKAWTFRFAAAALLLPLILIVLASSGILPPPPVFGKEPVRAGLSSIAAQGGVYASTLFLTAYFATYLSGKLHRKREEVQRFHLLSERLRSTIILEEVISIVQEELLKLTGAGEVKYFSLDAGRLSLVHGEGVRGERELQPSEIVIPLTDTNALSETLLSCVPSFLTPGTALSPYESPIFGELMKNAREVVVLPLWASFATRCSDYFHCSYEKECPLYGTEERRCWYVSGTLCRGERAGGVREKVPACIGCDMFKPLGVFIVDVSRTESFAPSYDIDACVRLLDAASLALSNAKLYARTLELSETDGLTGVKNRRAFLKLLHAEASRAYRYNKDFGLLMIDIDHFKSYNDRYGHPRGDMILRTAAEVMVHNLRDTDIIGRYGGEEFIALLPETKKGEAKSIGERIRSAVESYPFECAGFSPGERVTVSIGVASYPDDGLLSDEIIHAADRALYCAKKTGRNRVIPADPLLQ